MYIYDIYIYTSAYIYYIIVMMMILYIYITLDPLNNNWGFPIAMFGWRELALNESERFRSAWVAPPNLCCCGYPGVRWVCRKICRKRWFSPPKSDRYYRQAPMGFLQIFSSNHMRLT
jgi:hypothetical protein